MNDVVDIIEIIDKEICALTYLISFRNWMRAALDYTFESMKNLLESLFDSIFNLRDKLNKNLDRRQTYELIKNVNYIVLICQSAKWQLETVFSKFIDILSDL
jgi:hypothetical protein